MRSLEEPVSTQYTGKNLVDVRSPSSNCINSICLVGTPVEGDFVNLLPIYVCQTKTTLFPDRPTPPHPVMYTALTTHSLGKTRSGGTTITIPFSFLRKISSLCDTIYDYYSLTCLDLETGGPRLSKFSLLCVHLYVDVVFYNVGPGSLQGTYPVN